MNTLDLTIRSLFDDFQRVILPSVAKNLVSRDLSLGSRLEPRVGNAAKTVVGVRRSGKTFRLYQEMLAAIDAGIDPGSILYLNFDDDRLRPYPPDIISRALEVFFEGNPGARENGAYVFFDEIQEVDGWSLPIRRIIDTEKVSLYLAGSSSKLLSEDIASELRGRSIAYELLPYGFREFLRAQDREPVSRDGRLGKNVISEMRAALRRYLVCGGFPAVQGLDDIERVSLLQSYAQLTVARDVVERNKLSNAAYARNLARTLVSSSARDVSISRLDNKGKAAGYTPGRAKIAEIMDAFEDAHLVYQTYDFGYSAQKIRLGGLKVYAADPGLLQAMLPASSDGLAFSLETAVYLELRRRGQTGRLGDVAMCKLPSGREVDFICGDAAMGQASRLVQVSLAIESSDTRQRELRALREAMERFGLAEATIVTFDEEGAEETPEGVVRIVPAWKWFLE